MALQKQTVHIPFLKGLETKKAAPIIEPVKLLRAENVVFQRPGQLQKRAGSQLLGQVPTTGPFGGTLNLFNGELVALGGGALSSFSPTQDTFLQKQTLRGPRVSTKGVVSDANGQRHGDCCSANGVTMFAYEELNSSGGTASLLMVIQDEATGAILTTAFLESGGRNPHCLAMGEKLVCYYQSGNASIRYVVVDSSEPTTIGGVVTLFTGSVGATFAVCPDGGGAGLILYQSDSTHATLEQLSPTGAFAPRPPAPAPLVISGVTAATLTALNVNLCGGWVVCTWALTTQLYALTAQVATLTASAATAIGAAQTANITNCTAAVASGVFKLFCEVSASASYNTVVRSASITPNSTGASLVASSIADVLRSVGLASNAWTDTSSAGSGQALFIVTYDDLTQPTYFVVNHQGKVVAKLLAGVGIGLAANHLANAQALTASRMLFCLGARTRMVTRAGFVRFYTQGIRRLVVDFTSERCRSTQLSELLHIGGGFVSCYDGIQVVEDGFHLYPPQPVVGGGSIGLGIVTKGNTAKNVQTVSITPPADQPALVPPQTCGSQIRPGSYLFVFGGYAGAPVGFLLWFSVNGVGSAPSFSFSGAPSGTNIITSQVAISTAFNLEQVCQAIATAINIGFASVDPSIASVQPTTGSPTYVQVTTPYDTGTMLAPVDDTSLGYDVLVAGGASTAEQTMLVCPAGSWITGGQYFFLESAERPSPLTTNPIIQFYYVRTDVPTDPSSPSVLPAYCYATQAIDILSTDTPVQVATKTAAAVSAYQISSTSLWSSVSGVGPFVFLTSAANGVIETTGAGNPNTSGTTTRNGSVGGAIDSGSRLYVLTYEWTDDQGQFHQSAPSQPFRAVTGSKAIGVNDANNGGNNQNTQNSNMVTAETLRVTGRTTAQIGFWRTVAEEAGGGSIFYRLATIPNLTTTDTVSFLDSVSDENLTSADILYTSTGELENIGPPPAQVVVRHGDRVWLADIDDQDLLWYSKQFSSGYAPAWNDGLTVRVDKNGGPITAVASMDSFLVVFKGSRIFVVEGEGPDATGANGTFITRLVTTDVGCVSQDSVVLTDAGLMFLAKKGICLLRRDLSVEYIGAPVEAFTASGVAITSAVLVQDASRVRFATDTGVTLVYDLFVGEWSTFTYGSDHAIYWSNPGVAGQAAMSSYTWVDDQGNVWQEAAGTYLDPGGKAVAMLAQTSWLKASDIQGFGRAYRLNLLAQYQSKHKLLIDVCTDYDETVRQTIVFDAATALASDAYGSQNPYGAEPYYGGPPGTGVEAFTAWLAGEVATFEAIRFTIRELPEDAGAGVILQSLALTYGVKSTFRRAAQNRSV